MLLMLMEGPSTYLNEFGVRSGFVRGPFGIRSGSVRGPFGIRSGQFRVQIFGAKNLKYQTFSICEAVAAAAGAL